MDISAMGMLQWQNIQNDRLVRQNGTGASKAQDEKKLRDVCYDFEALFIKKMLDSMRKTVPENTLFGENMGQEIFEDMLYDEYSKKMARTAGLGIADMMYEQMSQKHTPAPEKI